MRGILARSAVVALVLVAAPAAALAQSTLHTFYARITDKAGAPIKGLGPDDFGVIEAGSARKVIAATYGGLPLRVLFLVDTSDAVSRIPNQLRAAMQAFIDGVPPEDEIALVTMGRQLRIRVQPTLDRKKLSDVARSIFADGGGTVLLDSLVEANDRVLMRAENRASAIVILTTDGAETSTAVREEGFNKLVEILVGRGTVVHAVMLENTGVNSVQQPSASAGTQSVAALNLTGNTGGNLETVAAATALADKMKATAQLLVTRRQKMSEWYQVDYTTSTIGPGRALDVTVSPLDAKVELSASPPR